MIESLNLDVVPLCIAVGVMLECSCLDYFLPRSDFIYLFPYTLDMILSLENPNGVET